MYLSRIFYELTRLAPFQSPIAACLCPPLLPPSKLSPNVSTKTSSPQTPLEAVYPLCVLRVPETVRICAPFFLFSCQQCLYLRPDPFLSPAERRGHGRHRKFNPLGTGGYLCTSCGRTTISPHTRQHFLFLPDKRRLSLTTVPSKQFQTAGAIARQSFS